MNEAHILKIAGELKVQPRQVAATAALFAQGATVPFIARYRKEATGSLDEVAVTSIRERLLSLAELDQRRDAILKSLAERNLLTDELKNAIAKSETLTALEDIYQPYRPKRRTRVTIAKELGLEPLADLLTGTPAEIVIGDKGFWGRDYKARLQAAGTTLLTPDKTRTTANLGRERALASTRLVIVSVFSNLKEQMRLEHHLARTPAGLVVRIAQRILALTLGMLLNTLNGRPARALAAYDGR